MFKKLNKKRLSFLLLVPSILVPITLVSCGNSNETSQSSAEEAPDIVDNSNNQYSVFEVQGKSVLSFSGNSATNKTVEELKNEIWSSADWTEQTVSSVKTYTAMNFKEVASFQNFLTTHNSFKNTSTSTSAGVDLNLNDVNFNNITSDLVIGVVSVGEVTSESFSSISVSFVFSLKEGSVWKNNQKNYGLVFSMTFMNMNTSS
ncbi:MAG: hypothetical protein K2N92_00285 [Malacoplasma sp.]|nr:hypothetical protein [Malacoplasma sp.]MDE5841621.1 hypothetical protein [Malacoplasma sp.]MDE6082260.1 hypothetical protein [Malacoplasma sp.]MDE7112015.1 hypothetical protein [Malacoplasma sp.]